MNCDIAARAVIFSVPFVVTLLYPYVYVNVECKRRVTLGLGYEERRSEADDGVVEQALRGPMPSEKVESAFARWSPD